MTGKIFKMCAVGAAVVGLTALIPLDAHAAVTYDTRALTGDAAPNTAAGVVYSDVRNPVLNGAGQTAFIGELTGTGVDSTNDTGLWSEGSGSLGLVAREGSAAPGTAPGLVYGLFNGRPLLNGSGQAAFSGFVIGTGVDSTNRDGIWSEGSGSLGLVARTGSAAPGTASGVVYSFLANRAFNDAGQIAFQAGLTGPSVDSTNSFGIWSEGSGSLGLVAREGSAAPGTAPGVVYDRFNGPVLNDAGQIAFFGNLTGTGVDNTNFRGIWSGRSDSLSLIARMGSAAPGTAAGVVYNGFGLNYPALNDAGQTAFLGVLTGPGVDVTNSIGIWSEGSGSLGLVARGGGAAPGTAPGVVYGGFKDPVLNGAGQTAFQGDLFGPGVDGTNNTGIWSEGAGSLVLIAREGNAAPGMAAGVVHGSINNNPVLNGAGQTAFQGFVTGPGVDNTNDGVLWATDLDGLLTLIAREGDLFDVNDDPLIQDLRRISLVGLTTGSGGEDGLPTSFNDAGQLAFKLDFTDGTSGIFVATIPEPASLTVLIVGTGLILSKRSTNLS